MGESDLTLDIIDETPLTLDITATGPAGGGQVDSVVAGNHITINSIDPVNPVIAATGFIESIVPGDNVSIDNTDPANPIINADGGGGGGGAVDSVNGMTGIVVISKSTIGLSNVDNTSDVSKPLSTAAVNALALKANISALAAVAFSGSYVDLINKPTPYDPTTDTIHALKSGDTFSGLVNFNSSLQIPSGASNGYVLTSDASGLASWQPGGSGSVSDATTSTKGIIQLAGDMAGTAALPTVKWANDPIHVLKAGDTLSGQLNTQDLIPVTNLSADLGAPSLYYMDAYAQRYYLNATAYIDGATAGSAIVNGGLIATARISGDTAIKIGSAYSTGGTDNLSGYVNGIYSTNTGAPVFVIKARPSQTADLFRIVNTANLAAVAFAPNGQISMANTNPGMYDYNTVDQTTNYERVYKGWVSNVYNMISQKGGTGTLRGVIMGTTDNLLRVESTGLSFTASGAVKTSIDGSGTLFIADGTSIPATNPTGGGFLYVESGALKYRGSAGTITVLGIA